MTPAGKRKILWWFLLAIGVGGSVVYFAILAAGDDIGGLWAWPVCTIALSIWSVFGIRKWYRLEPLSGPGLWQLRVADLVGAAIFAGGILTTIRSVDEKYLLIPGLPLVMVSGAGYVFGLLWSTRIGVEIALWRAVFSFGLALLVVGVLAASAVLVITIVLLAEDGDFELLRILRTIFQDDHAVLIMLRWPLVVLLPGILIFAFAWTCMPRNHAEKQDATP